MSYDKLLSNLVFNFNLRRYMMAELECDLRAYPSFTIELPKDNWRWAPGAHTRPLFSST